MLAMMLSLPSFLVFYVVWVVFMLLRPVFLIAVGCMLWNAPKTLEKAKLAAQGLLYMFFCKDKKWKKPLDPDSHEAFKNPNAKIVRKTIVFIRHGESTWNDTFNAGERPKKQFILGFIPGLFKAAGYEIYLLLSGQTDSWFYDAPLSHYGIAQIDKLSRFLAKTKTFTNQREKDIIELLKGESSASSVLVSSNLRRALSTVIIGLRGRLAMNPEEKIVIEPSLQEISRNPDTLAITPPKTQVNASWIEKAMLPQIQQTLTSRVDMSAHRGNKPLNTNGLKRMNAFCKFAFNRDEDAIIIGGHSLWFREFFKTFLPYSSKATCKTKKMVNGGCVGFVLEKAEGKDGPVYRIDESTLTVAYGGF